MHARIAFRCAAGALPVLALTLWACGNEPAPPAEPPEPGPPPAEMPAEPQPISSVPSEPIDMSQPFVPGQALPSGFPDDLPVPGDAEFVGSFVRGGMAGQWRSQSGVPELTDQLRGLFEASSTWKFEGVQEAGEERLLTASRGTTGVIAAVVPGPGGGSDINYYVIDISEPPALPPELMQQGGESQ